jgi:hypothetical protein
MDRHHSSTGEKEMNTDRKIARIVGTLFIIGTVAGILSVVFTGPVLGAADYLVEISAHENQIIIGSLLVLIMGFALAMVPVVLYPIFRKHNQALALGSVLFRGALEAVTYIAIVIVWLSLLALSREYMTAGSPDASYFQTLGALLFESIDWINRILSIVFSLGALMIYILFYRSSLIPRWLSVWGLIGGMLYLAAPLFAMFGYDFGILMAPLALQEMVLAVWLIVRGFSSSIIASESAQHDLLAPAVRWS